MRQINHPSLSSYNRGCRCDECKNLNRIRANEYRSRPVEKKNLTHGTQSSYVAGCRCEKYTEANTEASRSHYVRR